MPVAHWIGGRGIPGSIAGHAGAPRQLALGGGGQQRHRRSVGSGARHHEAPGRSGVPHRRLRSGRRDAGSNRARLPRLRSGSPAGEWLPSLLRVRDPVHVYLCLHLPGAARQTPRPGVGASSALRDGTWVESVGKRQLRTVSPPQGEVARRAGRRGTFPHPEGEVAPSEALAGCPPPGFAVLPPPGGEMAPRTPDSDPDPG